MTDRLRRLAAAVATRWRRALAAWDLQDAYTHGGLLLIGAGCWMAYPPSAGIAVGLALFWLGLGAPGIHGNRKERG